VYVTHVTKPQLSTHELRLKLKIMKKNMGNFDRVLRVVAAIIFAYLFFTDAVSGFLGNTLLALGAVFLLTSLVSFCPLYVPFGINTSEKK
jgi:hypothetical protein